MDAADWVTESSEAYARPMTPSRRPHSLLSASAEAGRTGSPPQRRLASSAPLIASPENSGLFTEALFPSRIRQSRLRVPQRRQSDAGILQRSAGGSYLNNLEFAGARYPTPQAAEHRRDDQQSSTWTTTPYARAETHAAAEDRGELCASTRLVCVFFVFTFPRLVTIFICFLPTRRPRNSRQPATLNGEDS